MKWDYSNGGLIKASGSRYPEQFKKEYQCSFEPDPLIRQYVELIKKSTRHEISIMRREGFLKLPQFKEAQQIIWREEDGLPRKLS